MRVDKVEAARRQLEVAAELYFADGDILAIHTLAAAGHEILRNLNKRRMTLVGEQPAPPFYNVSVKDIPSALAKLGIGTAESPKLLADACNEAENFLKHADRDWDATLEVGPEWTHLLLLDACRLYALLTGTSTDPLAAYFAWCQLQHPDQLDAPGQPPEIIAELRSLARQTIQLFTRAEFYEHYRRKPPVFAPMAPAPGMDLVLKTPAA